MIAKGHSVVTGNGALNKQEVIWPTQKSLDSSSVITVGPVVVLRNQSNIMRVALRLLSGGNNFTMTLRLRKAIKHI